MTESREAGRGGRPEAREAGGSEGRKGGGPEGGGRRNVRAAEGRWGRRARVGKLEDGDDVDAVDDAGECMNGNGKARPAVGPTFRKRLIIAVSV